MTRPTYRLIDNQPARCSLDEALAAWSDADRRVAQHQHGACYVSTVFLPFPPCDACNEPLALFETLVFDAEHQLLSKSWALTREQALAQHDRGVERARRSKPSRHPGLLGRVLPPLGLAA